MAQYKKFNKGGQLEGMSAIFAKVIKKMNIGKEFSNHMVLYYWPKIVGENLARQVVPVKVEYKKLIVKPSHPAWADQVRLLEPDIVKKVNAYLGEYVINGIGYTSFAPEATWDISEHQEEKKLGEELATVSLPHEEIAQITQECGQLENDTLMQKYTQLGIYIKKYHKYRSAKGWHKCLTEDCSGMCQQQEKYCAICKRKNRLVREQQIRDYLLDMPWARYAEVFQHIQCTPAEFNEQRVVLMQKLAATVDGADRNSFEVKVLVMLYFSLPPDQLTEEKIDKAMKKMRGDVINGFANNQKVQVK